MEMASLSDVVTRVLIPVAALVGIAFALIQWFLVRRVGVVSDESATDRLIEEDPTEGVAAGIHETISHGLQSFVVAQYKFLGVFVVVFGLIIFLILVFVDNFSSKSQANAISSTVAFLFGTFTSALSGFFSMKVFTFAIANTTWEARRGVGQAFIVMSRSAAVMGFLFAASGLLMLYVFIILSGLHYDDDWDSLYGSIIGCALGGSSVAFFWRIGGGIYAKAAKISAYFVRVRRNIPENDRTNNPAVIAGVVGFYVGDFAGMSSDLFGLYVESSCAALFVASTSSFGVNHDYAALSYPLMVNSLGIFGCLITSLFLTDCVQIGNVDGIKSTLNRQLLISSILMIMGSAMVTFLALPNEFTVQFGTEKLVKNWHILICVGMGLLIELPLRCIAAYYTNDDYGPVQHVGDSCYHGAATNVIIGLALGYKSVFISISVIIIVAYLSFILAAIYGIAMAASGRLSIIATRLAIDAYSSICDSAVGIADMSGMNRDNTDALSVVGRKMAAIGKGSAIGSAALVSFALFGSFVNRAEIHTIDLLKPKGFIGLILGAIIPYCFSAMTMKSVGSIALEMVNEALGQDNTVEEDIFIRNFTAALLKKMILLGSLIMLIPLIVGVLFGVEALAGLLASSFLSGIQIAISASNSGGAWDKAKTYIQAREAAAASEAAAREAADATEAATIGDTIGGALKDNLGPSLNILMAMESLVFVPLFAAYNGLLFQLF